MQQMQASFKAIFWVDPKIWAVWGAVAIFLSFPLYAYPRAYESFWRLHSSLGLSNLAGPDSAENPNEFAFSDEPAFSRHALMPQGDLRLSVLLMRRYLLRAQLLLGNLRNQQANLAFGLGNENAGLLLGLAQEYTLAHKTQQLGFGIYVQAFSNIRGFWDLHLESSLLTNSLDNAESNSYQNIYAHIRSIFLIAQFRLGLLGSLNLFRTGDLSLLQFEGKLLFGGSAPGRVFGLDFYLSVVGLANQGKAGIRYAALFFGAGAKLQLVQYRRISPGIYVEAWPFGVPLEGLASADTLAISVGFAIDFRFAPKSLWMPGAPENSQNPNY